MIRFNIFQKVAQRVSIRLKSDLPLNIEKLEEESTESYDVIDEDAKAREAQIELKRNKSRLQLRHRNILHETTPYKEPVMWFHDTLHYVRKQYGHYGSASNVDPSLCWPTQKELKDKREYESVAYPYTIPEMIADAKQKRKEKNERIHNRQKEIVEKMKKLGQFKQELTNKIAKKEAEAFEAKSRKDRLVEEVRRHFGYTIDPRDEKFKEMLEKKEKEQKKALKTAKKKDREEKMISALLNKKIESTEKQKE